MTHEHVPQNNIIPFFSGADSTRRNWHRLEPRLRKVAERGRFIHGPIGRELEEAISRFTGARHTVLVGSGSDALIILLRAAGITAGDEVIIPAYTFFATASAVLHVGARPVMVDILPESYAMDPMAAQAAITGDTRAIMPVHLFCQMADMAKIRDLAETHSLVLVEDSAEGIGMFMNGRHAGLWGEGGVLSFFPTKTLGALGDAGMVLTDNDDIAMRARYLRSYGGRVHPPSGRTELGYHSRCDELQAAVLLTRLETIEREIARRAELAARYGDRLADLDPKVTVPQLAHTLKPGNPVYYVYLIESDYRDELVAFLSAHGVETEVYYPLPLTDQPSLSGLPGASHPVPVARAASRRAVALPLYPDLTDEQLDRVCDLIHRFHEEWR